MVVIIQAVRRFAARWLPLLLWMALIFLASDQQSQQIPSFGIWDLIFKKGAHFLAYLVMALLAHRAVTHTSKPTLWAFLVAAGYAISDEWHQTFVPTRDGNLVDVFIDGLGAAAGLIILLPRLQRYSHWWT